MWYIHIYAKKNAQEGPAQARFRLSFATVGWLAGVMRGFQLKCWIFLPVNILERQQILFSVSKISLASARFHQRQKILFIVSKKSWASANTPSVPKVMLHCTRYLGKNLAFSQNVMLFVYSKILAIHWCITSNTGGWVWMLIIDCKPKNWKCCFLKGFTRHHGCPCSRPRCRTSSSCNQEAKSDIRRKENHYHNLAFGRQTWRPRHEIAVRSDQVMRGYPQCDSLDN